MNTTKQQSETCSHNATMSDFYLSQDWANVLYNVGVIPALIQLQQYSAFDGDAIPHAQVDDFRLLPSIVQPGYNNFVCERHPWNTSKDPLNLFDPNNSNLIPMDPNTDYTTDELLKEVMFEIIGKAEEPYDYTKETKSALKPGNKKTAYTYDHTKMLINYIPNEGSVSTTDKKTLCNFFTFIASAKGGIYAGSSLWTVYSAINANYQRVTVKKMHRLINLSKVMKNCPKITSHKKHKI